MAIRTTVTITDDIDGSTDAETFTFGFDGVDYEIDLAPKNLAKLQKVLTAHANAGRRSRPPSRPRGRTLASRSKSAKVRAWAKSNGYKVEARGKIPGSIVDEYEAALRRADAQGEVV